MMPFAPSEREGNWVVMLLQHTLILDFHTCSPIPSPLDMVYLAPTQYGVLSEFHIFVVPSCRWFKEPHHVRFPEWVASIVTPIRHSVSSLNVTPLS